MSFRIVRPVHERWHYIAKARTSREGHDILARLRSFLDAEEPKVVMLLDGLWRDQQQAITYQEIRTAILNGYIDEQNATVWMEDYSHFINEKLRPKWIEAMRAGASRIEADHPGLFFNAHDPSVENWLNGRAGELITVIGQEQRQAINAMIGNAYTGDWTVDELSRVIRPTIGLNKPQALANQRYYEHVKTSLLKDNPHMRESTAIKRAREASVKYAERQHRYRAFMIARTEMAFAYNRGTDEGVKQAISKGYMGACVRVWSTAADERMCSICGDLEGVRIGMDDEFDFSRVNSRLPSGPTPPAHPQCRCAVEYQEIEPPVYRESLPLSNDVLAETRNQPLTMPDGNGILASGEGIMQTGGELINNPEVLNLPDESIGRSLGSKARNYDILDLQTGDIYHLVEGSRLQNVQVFAGKGTRTIFRDASKYADRYGGDKDQWQHVKGEGLVETQEGDRSAELHWVQCDGIGKHEMFVKRWLDES